MLSLDWFGRHGRPVRYLDSQIKRGCFIQAGCVVTDGFGTGRITHALLHDRSTFQFHDPATPRRTTGLSAICSTVLVSFAKQDPFGHAPTAVFNDLRAHCPWALFSRKLLLPDIKVDSRFLGLAYTFKQQDCRYVFLLWHVRTAQRPDALIVPARQSNKHDLPFWLPVNRITSETLAGKPLEHLALGDVLGRTLGDTPPADQVGFLRWPKFEEVWKPPHLLPAIVSRETIILDLLLMYQQEFHGGRRSIHPDELALDNERALQRDLLRYLSQRCELLRLPVKVTSELTLGFERRAGRVDIVLEVFDHANEDRPPELHYRFLIECKLSDNRNKEPEYFAQALEYQAQVVHFNDERRRLEGFHAIVLLHGLRGPHHRYLLQLPETHPHKTTPIHVVRVALTPATSSSADAPRQVAHAIIPLRTKVAGVRWLLFTWQTKDPNPRLPGGKLETGENPEQALRRELREELELNPGHIFELIEVNPGDERHEPGFAVTDMSMKRGEENLYRMHPFIVLLTETGKRHILTNLNKGAHRPRPALIDDWLAGDFGHKADYARTVHALLNPELLEKAAVNMEQPL